MKLDKRLLSVLFIFAICVSFSSGYIVSGANSPLIISKDTMRSYATVVFYTDTSHNYYYTLNGYGNGLTYTNFASLFNTLTGSPNTDGYLYYFTNGNYNITSSMVILNKHNIVLAGQSYSASIWLSNNANCDMLKIINSSTCVVKDLFFIGNRNHETVVNQGVRGIYTYNCDRVYIYHNQFFGTKQDAIWCDGNINVMSLQPWIVDNHIEGVGSTSVTYGLSNGITIKEAATDAHIRGNDIGDSYQSGLYIKGSGAIISENSIWTFNQYGLQIEDGSGYVISANIIDGTGISFTHYYGGISNTLLTGNRPNTINEFIT